MAINNHIPPTTQASSGSAESSGSGGGDGNGTQNAERTRSDGEQRILTSTNELTAGVEKALTMANAIKAAQQTAMTGEGASPEAPAVDLRVGKHVIPNLSVEGQQEGPAIAGIDLAKVAGLSWMADKSLAGITQGEHVGANGTEPSRQSVAYSEQKLEQLKQPAKDEHSHA